jgi:hypothetical protein
MRSAIGNAPPRADDTSRIYEAANAIIMMRRWRESLRKLFDYGEPLHVVRSDVSRILGVDVL